MKIVITTENNKTVFSAHVPYKGEEFMVYGFAPPAPKSTYILVSGNRVGTAKVPDEVAKAIYTQLKSGSKSDFGSTDTFTYPDGSTDVPALESSLSDISGATVNFTKTNDYQVVLNLSYPDGISGRITIALLPSKGFITVKLSNGLKTSMWYDDIPRPIYYPKSFFKLSPYDIRELDKYGESIQSTLTAIAPYIITQQKVLYPPIEEAFPGFKSKSTVDKRKLNALVKYVTSRPYANFQVYLDGKKFSSNCTYEYVDIETQSTYFIDNNIAILCDEKSTLEEDITHSSGVIFGYGHKISKSMAQKSIYGKYDMTYMVVAPDIFIHMLGDNGVVYSEGSRFNINRMVDAQESLSEEMGSARENDGDVSIQKMYELVTDETFLQLLDSVQKSTK